LVQYTVVRGAVTTSATGAHRQWQKIILDAWRSVFTISRTHEHTFANTEIRKNLLRGTWAEQLWKGEQQGLAVEVWAARARLPRPTPGSRELRPI
jgi:hypothetical protein